MQPVQNKFDVDGSAGPIYTKMLDHHVKANYYSSDLGGTEIPEELNDMNDWLAWFLFEIILASVASTKKLFTGIRATCDLVDLIKTQMLPSVLCDICVFWSNNHMLPSYPVDNCIIQTM